MSGPARLVVVCGVGTPSAAVADASVRAARDEGWQASLVVADDVEPAVEVSADPWRALLDAGLHALGATTLPAATLGLASARHAAVLTAVEVALAGPEGDVVVLDAGDQRAARDLLAHSPAVEAAIGAVLGPRLAMGSSGDADGAFDRLTAARATADRQARVLTGPDAVWRVVVAPRVEAASRALDVLAALAVLGARVDGVLLGDYPRKDFPSAVRDEAAAARKLLEDQAGVRVARAGTGRRPAPDGASTRGAGPTQPVLRTHDPLGDDKAWEWGISLPDLASRVARVGVSGDRLVVEVDGSQRWLDLPAVLRRTVAVDVAREPGGLLVRFRPDPSTWRSAQEDP